ncbi:uncharacterized protein LOC143897373 [Temnothorax americanus]|uniref:uncharacterized protein LOC143897373 n=1 Tax=Temnothorax americanus TaxID=1964332 RepID=UPI0040692B25
MNILPRILTFLSHEKLRMTHALNESLKIPQRLLALHIAPSRMISYRNFSTGKNDSTIDDLLLLERNINKGTITRVKRGKSTQSSCEKDDTKPRRERKDHQQSAESCEKPREWRSDGYQIPTESYRKTCSDLLSHREYYQSIESTSPICANKPAPYNDWQACESSKHESYESIPATRITSEKWVCGKPATERKIYYKCKPKPCIYSGNQEKPICFPSSRDHYKDKSDEVTKDKSKQIAAYPTQLCPESEPTSSKKIILNEKRTSPVKHKVPKERFASDTHEYDVKPDPPPPRYPHWSENPPSYCDHRLKKTSLPPVKGSPIIFISKKGPQRSRAKDTVSSPQNIHEDSSRSANENESGRTDAKALQKSVSRKRVIFSEDKCAASSTIPAPVDKTMESEIQQFPTLTKDGRCCAGKPEKELGTSNVNDCNPNMASFKYRLSKCPCIKEMWGIGVKREPPVDVSVRQMEGALLSHGRKMKRPESRPGTTGRRRRRFRPRTPGNGWTRQRYKVRLKIFQKGNGRLDPCLPRIVELIHPRGEGIRPKLLKSAANKGEFSSRSRNSCPHYCSSKTPIAETKSYPTKMDESRVIRDQYLGKHPCKKHR